MEDINSMNSFLSSKERLARYDLVNKCETPEELCDVIRSFADDFGIIHGRSRDFNAERMANNALAYMTKDNIEPNVITREFGLRQQAMHIKYFTWGRGKELYDKQIEEFKEILKNFPNGVWFL